MKADRAEREATRARDALAVNFAWLVRLRFGAVLGQALVIAGVELGMGLSLPLSALALVIALELAVNVWSVVHLRRGEAIRERHVALVLAADLVLFSVLLALTGGPSNPFGFLYLIHIALAAIVLPQRTSFGLVALALGCSLALFFANVPLPHDHTLHHAFGWHQRGMWVAFGIAAVFIVYFIQRVLRELATIEHALRASRERAARSEQVAALGMLSAGAAHELASPLSTIAVANSELLRRIPPDDDVAREDLELIRTQVERCRAIIAQLSADAGQPAGGSVERLEPRQIVAAALSGLEHGRVRLIEPVSERTVVGPLRPLSRALRNLLDNALDAGAAEEVELRVAAERGEVSFEVCDRGAGMSEPVLSRAREPFFTTKPRGQGMGLGLFLVENVADQLGGRLELESRQGGGTRARLVLPQAFPSCRRSVPTAEAEPSAALG